MPVSAVRLLPPVTTILLRGPVIHLAKPGSASIDAMPDAKVSENSNRPAFMLPAGSSGNEAMRLTALDIQLSFRLST